MLWQIRVCHPHVLHPMLDMTHILSIRPAVMADSVGIAAVNIQSWKETYPGIMPAQRIDGMNMESCAKHWQANIEGASYVLVAEVNGSIVGFASGGDNYQYQGCETGLGNACDCELGALYMLQQYHGRGIGKALFQQFTMQMRREQRKTMIVWVAEKNKSTEFYAAMNGELVDRKILLVCEEPIPVIGYQYTL